MLVEKRMRREKWLWWKERLRVPIRTRQLCFEFTEGRIPSADMRFLCAGFDEIHGASAHFLQPLFPGRIAFSRGRQGGGAGKAGGLADGQYGVHRRHGGDPAGRAGDRGGWDEEKRL